MAVNSSLKPLRACFSYAAYTKNLIDYLKSFNIPIEQGLTDAELSSIESNLSFTFPPDLRSVLQEGLPVGPGFPNWRSASTQQLEILTNLPILSLCKEISRNCFWLNSWGERPKDNDKAVSLGKGFLKEVPVLIPVYRNFYIPAAPVLAGNPLFYVRDGDVRLWCFDIAGFFHQVELRVDEDVLRRPTLSKLLDVPAWAATDPRRIDFWTDLLERGKRLAAIGGWWGDDCLGGRLEDVFWRLRNGGWKEEEVREMMMMDGCDDVRADDDGDDRHASLVLDRGCIVRHVEIWSKRLLHAGWSTEDVMDSLGSSSSSSSDDDQHNNPTYDDEYDQDESWFDCRQSISSNWDDDNQDDYCADLTKQVMMNSHPVEA